MFTQKYKRPNPKNPKNNKQNKKYKILKKQIKIKNKKYKFFL